MSGGVHFGQYNLWRNLEQAKMRASRAGQDASRAKLSVEQLSEAIDHLSLACMAMWELLRERTGATDEDLAQHIMEIDLRDGSLDGKLRRQPIECGSCGRKNNAKRTACLYCGASQGGQDAFPVNPGDA